MKTIISIMIWINRVLMTPFFISLLISILDTSYLFYSLYIAFALGCFQVSSSLITLFYNKKIKNFKLILIYLLSLVLYFFGVFLFFEFERHITVKDEVIIIFWFAPIALSIFWTYILESIKKEL